MGQFKILVACGAGIATSTVVTDRVERLVKENNVDAEVKQIKISEAASMQDGADLIVSTTILPTTYKISDYCNFLHHWYGYGRIRRRNTCAP